MREYTIHARLAHLMVALRVHQKAHIRVEVARRFAYWANVWGRVSGGACWFERRGLGQGMLLYGEAMERMRQMRRTAIFSTFLGGRTGCAGGP